jgi:DNA-binding NarL/FixJ family response regulator
MVRRRERAGMTGPATVRVLIADDQRVVRDGLVMLVGLCEGIEVVGAAPDGATAVAMVAELAPDVVLMDLRMPEMDGVAATREIAGRSAARVVVLTTYADDESIFPALRAGAVGYLTKDASGEEIEAAIRAVHRGQTWLDPVVQARLVSALGSAAADEPASPPPVLPDSLTPREAEVLGLIGEGLSNREIGERLVLGQATVKTHVNRIFAKIGAQSRAQAVRYAIGNGLARPGAGPGAAGNSLPRLLIVPIGK